MVYTGWYNPVEDSTPQTAIPDNSAPEWADYLKQAGAAGAGAAAAVESGLSYLNDKAGFTDAAQLEALDAQITRNTAGDIASSMTPQAQQIVNGSWADHPLRKAVMTGIAMTPALAATALPGGIVADAFGGLAGAATTAALSAGFSAGQFADDVAARVDQAPDAELRKQSPTYDEMRKTMSEQDARDNYRDYLADGQGRMALTLIGGALGGGFGIGGQLARGATGRMVGHAVEAGLAGGAQTGLGDAALQGAMIQGGFQSHADVQEWAKQTLESMGIGAVLGGAHGLLPAHGSETQYPKAGEAPPRSIPQVETTDAASPDAAQSAALAATDKGGSTPPPPAAPEAQPPVQSAPAPEQSPQQAAAPPVTPESNPAPQPATDAAQPEAPGTLQIQQQELMSGKRPVMVFKAGESILPVPDGFKQVKVGPDVYQYDPGKLTAQQIMAMVRKNTIGEALGLGPVTKDDAIASAQQGATPVAITERTPEGVEVKAAAGTDETAPVQQAALEANKTPGNTVQLEPPQNVIAGRIAAQTQEAQPAPQPRPAPPPAREPLATAPVAPTGRVLDDTSPQAQQNAKAGAKQVQQNIAAATPPEEKAPVGRKDLTPEKIAARQRLNEAAKQIVEANPPGPTEANVAAEGGAGKLARLDVRKRAKAMLDALTEAKLSLPQSLRDNANAAHNYNEHVALLARARRIANGAAKITDYPEFLEAEKLARGGDRQTMVDLKRADDATKFGMLGSGGMESGEARPVEGHDAGGEDVERTTPEEANVRYDNEPTDDDAGSGGAHNLATGGEDAALERIAPGHEDEQEAGSGLATAAIQQRERDQADVAARIAARRAEGAAVATGESKPTARADMAKVQITTARRRTIPVSAKVRRLAVDDGRVPVMASGGDIAVSGTRKLRDVLGGLDVENWQGHAEGVAHLLANKLSRTIGGVDVHYADPADIRRAAGPNTVGFYDPINDHIVLPNNLPAASKTHVVLHEAVHAATLHGIVHNDEAAGLLDRLYTEARAALGTDERFGYAFAKEHDWSHEFLSEALSNPELRDALSKLGLSASLKRDLGLEAWRKSSAWNGLLGLIKKVIGLPNIKDNALEAAISLGERFSQERGGEDGVRGSSPRGLVRHAETDGSVEESGVPDARARSPAFLGGGGGGDTGVRELTPQEAGVGASEGSPGERGRLLDRLARASSTALNAPEDALDEARDPHSSVLTKQRLLSSVSDQVAKTRSWASEASARWAPKFLSNDQLRQAKERLFGDASEMNPVRRLVDGVEKANTLMRKLLQPADAIAGDMWRASRAYEGPVWEQFAQLINDSTVHNVNPDAALDSDANAHLRLPKGAKNDSEGAMAVWQARAMHPELAEAYNSLPSDLRSLYQRARDYYAGERDARVRQHVQAILEAHDAPEGSTHEQIAQRVFNGQMTDEDEAHYEQFGIGKALKSADDLQKTKGPYFPLKRRGDYVVTGEHDVAGGKVQDFDSREEAHAFATRQTLPTKVRKIYFDPETGEETTKVGGLSTAGSPVEKYRATVQNQHVAFAETEAKAEAARQTMLAAGLKNVSAVDKVRKNAGVDYGLRSSQLDQLIKAVERRSDLNDAQKATLARSLEESSVALQRGNRLESHYLERRGVAGASTDVIKNLSDYAHASAAFRSRAEFKSEIDGALQEMRDITDQDRSDPNTLERRRTVQEYENRLEGFGSPEYQGKLGPFWQKLMMLSFLKRMASPAHLALHLMHPVMTSIPVIGGERGLMRTYREFARAYNDLGARGALGEGVKGLARAARENAGPTSFGDYFRKQLSNVGDREALGAMMKELEATGHLHPDAGFDVARYASDGSRLDQGLERVDRAFRELTSATESVNRYGTAVAAYRLAVKDGMSHEQAVRYAKDSVANTQGLYSATNAAPIFRKTGLKPFMQFKQYPAMVIHLMGKLVHSAFAGETPEARQAALRSFGMMMGTATLLTGVNGLPTEAAKAVTLLGNALGVTPSWDELENNTRMGLAHELGPELSNLIMNGVSSLGPTAVDVHHRLGFSSMLTFGEPKSDKPDDVVNWLEGVVGGAPVSMLSDTLAGAQALRHGDLETAFEKLTPVKALDDLAKAGREAVQGKTTPSGKPGMRPLTIPEAAMQALGFTPRSVADYGEARFRAEQASKEREPDQKGKKPGVGPKGQQILGLAKNKKNAAILNDYAKSYGVAQ
jgi:hypothetical protein